jgi:hypothetical protein
MISNSYNYFLILSKIKITQMGSKNTKEVEKKP